MALDTAYLDLGNCLELFSVVFATMMMMVMKLRETTGLYDGDL